MVKEKRARGSYVLVLPLPLQGHINPMLQFSKRLTSKGLEVTFIITPSIAKSMQGQDSSINLEPIFDGSKESQMAANIDKYFDRYMLTIPHSLSKLIDRYNVTAVLYHAAQGAFQVPVVESDQAAVSLPSLENSEFSDLPSFVSDAGSYPAIRELLLGQFSNFLEARWLIWNNFNELEVVNWMRINKWPIKTIGPMIPSIILDKRLGDAS
ncbi:PREDICTED: UDP-glycosyltransferase 74E1-like [Populus euphratica]|uniref:UDP-glycosyltransferase 74E1-like n=1 Tax=Populus euphratica TaxID=75702 RepID=A0AAJ6Y9N4_POPEU|nr:PREDICTED: UDP-glycosyltransferase 74E1-like [Populus euphratica]